MTEPADDETEPEDAREPPLPKDEEPESALGGAPGDDGAKSTRRPPRDERGMNRPEFLLDFPEDPDLERLITAFEAGNYAFIREEAERVAERAGDPAVRDAALELRRRIDPDPLAKYLLAISVLLLVALTVWAYLHQSHS